MDRRWALAAAEITLLAALLVVAGRGAAGLPRSGGPVINEVEYDPLGSDSASEWLELYNPTSAPVDVTGWTLRDNYGSDSLPALVLPPGGMAVVAASASFYDNYPTFTGTLVILDSPIGNGLSNTGDRLYLEDGGGGLVDALSYGTDSSVFDCSGLPCAGVAEGHSLEREPAGYDSDGPADFVERAPPRPGCCPLPLAPGADLGLAKRGPATALAGEVLTYTVVLSNAGQLPAAGVRLTDSLPAQVTFLAQTAPFTFHQPLSQTLVWEVGRVPTDTAAAPITFTLTCQAEAEGLVSNVITATTVTTETNPANNRAAAATLIGPPLPAAGVLIDALYYDGYAAYDYDEAVRLYNAGPEAVEVGGWRLAEEGSNGAALPPGVVLASGETIWCTRRATAFEEQFGFKADFETDDTDPAVPELDGAWPGYANGGGTCLLRDVGGQMVDALVYEEGNPGLAGWSGPAVWPWNPSPYFGQEGQVLYRKRDESTGRPLADTGTAADWAQEPADPLLGRRVFYPGWDLDRFFWTARLTETAVLTVAVAPDHLLDVLLAEIGRAQTSIQIEAYTLESGPLAQALLERLAAGVEVTLLLEGGPAGGASSAQGWIGGQIHDAGGQVWFMTSAETPARYRYQHAKVMVIDGRRVLIGSENLNPSALPADDKANGTAGRRGVYLIADAPGLAAHLAEMMAADLDPAHHGDLVTCADRPDLCTGSPPLPEPDWLSYTVAFSAPLAVQGEMAFEVVQAPENNLRAADGLLGLVGRAGVGDTVLVEQLYEQVHWGPAEGTPQSDPNPRLEAYLDAARWGARVRLLLNGYTFAEYTNENVETAAYLEAVARAEGLDLQVRLANPTGLGLHNKMVLVRAGGRGYAHVGSLNGSEVSAKANREVALQVQSDEVYDYLAAVFEHDWRSAPPRVYLPLVLRQHQAPQPAGYPLISEVFYAVAKEEEWVEVLNPTGAALSLAGYQLGDAQRADAFEGMYRFPLGAVLGPGQVLVVAASAQTFEAAYGRAPDFEFYQTDPAVPTLQASTTWGTGEWQLANAGDEVLLLDVSGRPVDVVVYGDGAFQGVIPHPGVTFSDHSLERYPARLDSDDCSLDFRDWPFPNPGQVP